jgi:hypothetical protein
VTSIDPQVCSQNLDERLPGWTETDIYVALTRIWLDLGEEGLAAGPEGQHAARRPRSGRATAQSASSSAPPHKAAVGSPAECVGKYVGGAA